VLVLVAHTLAQVLESLGGTGTAFRYGGEEFSVLVAGSTIEGTAAVAEHLRAALQSLQGPVPITASFGVSGFGGAAHDETTLLLQADAALLRAKQTGRNRVTIFDPADVASIGH
jgi:diguanylate cyclase (GGDEF)-like protein